MKKIPWENVLKIVVFITIVVVSVVLLKLFSNQKNSRDLKNHIIGSMQNQTKQDDISIHNLSSIPDRTKVDILVSKSSTNEFVKSQLDDSLLAKEALLTVEVVHSPASTALGLSGRSEIGSDGMLFVFDKVEQRYFWMKDMLFDLDMVWIRDGEIVGITQNVPKPEQNVSLAQLERYYSPGPVDMVLEIPAGEAQKLSLFKGDTLRVK